jgi:hypothetical protein
MRKVSDRIDPPKEIPPEPTTDGRGRYASIPEAAEEEIRIPQTEPRATKTALNAQKPKQVSHPPRERTSQQPRGAAVARMTKRKCPRLAKTDLASASIAPRDAFILSRIDGTLTVEELADLTGLRESDVTEALQRMARLGLVLL